VRGVSVPTRPQWSRGGARVGHWKASGPPRAVFLQVKLDKASLRLSMKPSDKLSPNTQNGFRFGRGALFRENQGHHGQKRRDSALIGKILTWKLCLQGYEGSELELKVFA